MKSILSILCLVCIGIPSMATSRTFSGTTGNWNVAANWTPASIPAAGDDITIGAGKVVTIPAAYAAVARSIGISGGGTLTVVATGTLAVNGAIGTGTAGNGIYLTDVTSALTNSGTINIGNTALVNLRGIFAISAAIVTNTSTGVINIDNINTYTGIEAGSSAGIINSGLIKIGNIAAIKQNAVYLSDGAFTNTSSGFLECNRTGANGNGLNILSGSTFNNNGSIKIGNVFAVNYNGINVASGAIFNNNSGASSEVFAVTNRDGLINAGQVTNAGALTLGSVRYGLVTTGTTAVTTNSGTINISNATYGIVHFSGTATNSGVIKVNNISPYVCMDEKAGIFTNSGTMLMGNTGTINGGIYMNGGTFDNEATLQINNITNTSGVYAAITAGAGAVVNSTTGSMSFGTSSPIQTGIAVYGGSFDNNGAMNFGSGISSNGIDNGNSLNNNTGASITVAPGSTLTIAGGLNNSGTISNSATSTLAVNGTLTNNAGGIVTNNGILKGIGTITQGGTFTNTTGSHIAPGNSPGTLTVTGNLDLGSATVDVEVKGNTTALYDVLAISGAATLTNASLNVILDPGYTPGNGDVITVINAGTLTGTFSSTSTSGFNKRYNYPAAGNFSLGTSVALPVKTLYFTAANAGTRNRIDWATATEYPGTSFEITRSSTGHSFVKIGTVAGKGPNAAYTSYDNQPINGVNYYRLKIMEASGTTTYSNVAVVSGDAKSSIVTVSPTPATNSLRIISSDVSLNGSTSIIYNMQGNLVYSTILTSDQMIDISSWAPGIYSLHLANGTVVRIVKQ